MFELSVIQYSWSDSSKSTSSNFPQYKAVPWVSATTDGSPGDVWELWSRLRFLRPIRDGPGVLLESLSGLFARACTAARGPVVILVTNSDSFSLSSSFLFSSVLFLRSNPSGYQYLCRFAFVGAPSRGTIAKKIAIPSSTSLVHQCANLLREFISFEFKRRQNGLVCSHLYKSVWKIQNSTNFPNFIFSLLSFNKHSKAKITKHKQSNGIKDTKTKKLNDPPWS